MNMILKWLLGKLVETFGGIFELYAAMSGNVFDQSVVKTIFTFFQTIGLPLIGLAMMSMLFKVMLEHADGKGFQVMDILKRFVGGVIIYSFGLEIMKSLYVVLMGVTGKIISVIANVATEDMKIDFDDFGFSLTSILLVVILTAICIYYMIKSFMDILERTWQYVVILCMMYIYTTGYIMGNDESIISWFKQCLAIIFSQFFQITLVSLGITLYVSAGGVNDFLFGIGAIIASAKVEQLLDRFGMGSGCRIGNAMRNAMSMGFYGSSIIRSFRKGG